LRAEYAIEGMDIARIQQANLVLMDMYLPDIDGINSTRMLRADSRTAHIQVIAVTASAMQGDEDDFRAAGCDGFVTKTIRYKEFLIVLRAIELRRVTTTPQ
jgi:two-component system cell cycle response regulator DivK